MPERGGRAGTDRPSVESREAAGVRRLVVDASVAVKWLIPEAQAEDARWVLETAAAGAARLLAPGIWAAEVANVLWRRTRGTGAELAPAEAGEMLDRLLRVMGPRLHATPPLARAAFGIAAEAGVAVYDALYLALALREAAPFVTADERLVRKLRGGPYQAHILSLRGVRVGG